MLFLQNLSSSRSPSRSSSPSSLPLLLLLLFLALCLFNASPVVSSSVSRNQETVADEGKVTGKGEGKEDEKEISETVESNENEWSGKREEVERVSGLTSEEFFREYWDKERPVILTDAIKNWSALRLWTPELLKNRFANASVEVQTGRSRTSRFEEDKMNLRTQVPWQEFVSEVQKSEKNPTNDFYLTALNRLLDRTPFQELLKDCSEDEEEEEELEKGLTDGKDGKEGKKDGKDGLKRGLKAGKAGKGKGLKGLKAGKGPGDGKLLVWPPPKGSSNFWLGPKGTWTPLHFDPPNILHPHVFGRKRWFLIDSREAQRLCPYETWFSAFDPRPQAQEEEEKKAEKEEKEEKKEEKKELGEEKDSNPSFSSSSSSSSSSKSSKSSPKPSSKSSAYVSCPQAQGVKVYESVLGPGDTLFVPGGWWHAVQGLEISVSISFTAFTRLPPRHISSQHPFLLPSSSSSSSASSSYSSSSSKSSSSSSSSKSSSSSSSKASNSNSNDEAVTVEMQNLGPHLVSVYWSGKPILTLSPYGRAAQNSFHGHQFTMHTINSTNWRVFKSWTVNKQRSQPNVWYLSGEWQHQDLSASDGEEEGEGDRGGGEFGVITRQDKLSQPVPLPPGPFGSSSSSSSSVHFPSSSSPSSSTESPGFLTSLKRFWRRVLRFFSSKSQQTHKQPQQQQQQRPKADL